MLQKKLNNENFFLSNSASFKYIEALIKYKILVYSAVFRPGLPGPLRYIQVGGCTPTVLLS